MIADDDKKSDVQEIWTKPESAVLNIRGFGAVADGKHIDTLSLQAAIAAAPKGGDPSSSL